MEDENGRMAAMQAEFQKLREDLTSMREEIEAQREKRETAAKEKQQIGNLRRSWRGLGRKGRWTHLSPGKVVVMQLIVEELLFRVPLVV